jgi:hypothetical protein
MVACVGTSDGDSLAPHAVDEADSVVGVAGWSGARTAAAGCARSLRR